MADKQYKVGLNQEQDVLIDWGESHRYIVLTPEHALELAGWLVKHAKKSTKAPKPQ
jgi:hypothetical protein